MIYRTRPSKVMAWQFLKKNVSNPPEWVIKKHNLGEISITINSKSSYLSINSNGFMVRAYIGDWIVIDSKGDMRVYSDASFRDSFEKV